MNIGITCYPTYGGSGTVATELGKSLASRGHNIHFISTSIPYRLTEFIRNIYYHEVQVLNYPLFDYTPYSLALASKMAIVARRENLDILHVHYAIPHAASAFLAQKILGEEKYLPYITTLHGTDITLVGADPSYFEITKFSIEQSDAVTAVSKYLKNQTYYRFSVKNEIDVIPNFVDTDLFAPKSDDIRDCLANKDEKILMHISNFRPVKRIADIIEVFELVSQKVKSRLVLVGSGPEKEKARLLAETKGLTEKITFLGVQNDVSDIIKCADAYLLISTNESFGLTALEAMSSGIPVIGTSGSGMDEFVGESGSGLLFQPGDIHAIAEGCIEILKNKQLAKEMGKKGRETALAKFNRSHVTDLYENLYKKAICQCRK